MKHLLFFAVMIVLATPVLAGDLVVHLTGETSDITFVGAFERWDMDGNHNRLVNGKARISAPEIDATADSVGGGRWKFDDLEPGTYDIVIMKGDQVRIEGWHYPPVLDFDPFFPPDATCEEETREWIENDIRTSRHYENKVEPLAIGGDDKMQRCLVMLIRDQTTSYEGHLAGAATMRFEVWEYIFRYGGWVKQERTRVLHRVMTTRGYLRETHWLWAPGLGNVEVGAAPSTLEYEIPELDDESLLGLRPY
jgi:hypothetical protein